MTDESSAPVAPPARKRRGLTLPPKGQALTRLQDLEAPEAAPGPAPTPQAPPDDAVPTASSTAGNTAVLHHGSTEGRPGATVPPNATPPRAPAPLPAPARATREPTTRITVDMPDSLHKRISFLSVETRRSIKELVIAALEATYFTPEAGGDTPT